LGYFIFIFLVILGPLHPTNQGAFALEWFVASIFMDG
jgi:hypothetical protein